MPGKDLELEYFPLRFLDLITHQEVPKLFDQQEQDDSPATQGSAVRDRPPAGTWT